MRRMEDDKRAGPVRSVSKMAEERVVQQISTFGPSMSDRTFEKYQKLIYDECRIQLKPIKKSLVINRLMKRLRVLGIADFEQYFRLVTEGPKRQEELQQLIDAITTNKTDFFREPKQWLFLEKTLWSVLQQEKRLKKDYTVRIWSSASSTGEEPYSIAIHALENLNRLEPWQVQIIASDISERVLAKARAGVYEESKMMGVPGALLHKYFDKKSTGYRVKPEVRNLVSFRNINLKGTLPRFGQSLDILFCRNVIIYFDQPTQVELMKRFYHCLRVGGYLFLGHSESLNGICNLYRFVSASIYQKES